MSPALAPWASLLGDGAYALLQDITGDLIADTARRLADQRASPEGIEGLSAFFEKRPPVRWRSTYSSADNVFAPCVSAHALRVWGREGGVKIACEERGGECRCHARGVRLRPGVPCLRAPFAVLTPSPQSWNKLS